MTTHTLKTLDVYWDAVRAGKKRFEVRRNDRAFQSGDAVSLIRIHEAWNGEFISTPGYAPLLFTIGWMLQGGQFGLAPDYCVFQLEEPVVA